jgi:hypothetical protein
MTKIKAEKAFFNSAEAGFQIKSNGKKQIVKM